MKQAGLGVPCPLPWASETNIVLPKRAPRAPGGANSPNWEEGCRHFQVV